MPAEEGDASGTRGHADDIAPVPLWNGFGARKKLTHEVPWTSIYSVGEAEGSLGDTRDLYARICKDSGGEFVHDLHYAPVCSGATNRCYAASDVHCKGRVDGTPIQLPAGTNAVWFDVPVGLTAQVYQLNAAARKQRYGDAVDPHDPLYLYAADNYHYRVGDDVAPVHPTPRGQEPIELRVVVRDSRGRDHSDFYILQLRNHVVHLEPLPGRHPARELVVVDGPVRSTGMIERDKLEPRVSNTTLEDGQFAGFNVTTVLRVKGPLQDALLRFTALCNMSGGERQLVSMPAAFFGPEQEWHVQVRCVPRSGIDPMDGVAFTASTLFEPLWVDGPDTITVQIYQELKAARAAQFDADASPWEPLVMQPGRNRRPGYAPAAGPGANYLAALGQIPVSVRPAWIRPEAVLRVIVRQSRDLKNISSQYSVEQWDHVLHLVRKGKAK
jgi:hypothetical protein